MKTGLARSALLLHHLMFSPMFMWNVMAHELDRGKENLSQHLSTEVDKALEHVRANARSSAPLHENSANLAVYFRLYHVVRVDDRRQELWVKAHVRFAWIDGRVRWDEDTSKATSIRFFGSKGPSIWEPIVKIQQSTEEPEEYARQMMDVHSDGLIHVSHFLVLRATCPMRTANFPVDVQKCPLTFYCISCYMHAKPATVASGGAHVELWPQFRDEMNITAVADIRPATKEGLQENNMFQVTQMNVSLKDHTPIIILTMERRSTYYFFYLLAPGLLIMFVCFLQFWIPTHASAIKVGIGVSCLLAMNIFFTIIKKSLSPDVEGALPLIARFFGAEMLIITLVTICSTTVIQVNSRWEAIGSRPPSKRLRMLFHRFGCMLGMRESCKVLGICDQIGVAKKVPVPKADVRGKSMPEGTGVKVEGQSNREDICTFRNPSSGLVPRNANDTARSPEGASAVVCSKQQLALQWHAVSEILNYLSLLCCLTCFIVCLVVFLLEPVRLAVHQAHGM